VYDTEGFEIVLSKPRGGKLKSWDIIAPSHQHPLAICLTSRSIGSLIMSSLRISSTRWILLLLFAAVVSGCTSNSSKSEKVGNSESTGTSVEKLGPPADMSDRITRNEAYSRVIEHSNYIIAQNQQLEMNFSERVEEALSAAGISDVDIAGCGGAGRQSSCTACPMTVSGISPANLDLNPGSINVAPNAPAISIGSSVVRFQFYWPILKTLNQSRAALSKEPGGFVARKPLDALDAGMQEARNYESTTVMPYYSQAIKLCAKVAALKIERGKLQQEMHSFTAVTGRHGMYLNSAEQAIQRALQERLASSNAQIQQAQAELTSLVNSLKPPKFFDVLDPGPPLQPASGQTNEPGEVMD